MASDQYMLRALDYIENNLSRDIDLYKISREAGFSVPHFYRLFKRLTGDTVGAYILRRRLTKAARDLTASRKNIADIAFEYGFESHDVFTRAFTRVYGMSPNKYRRSNAPPPFKRMEVIKNNLSREKNQMSFTLFETEGLDVIGMECTAKLWDSDHSIGRLWNDFLLAVEGIKNLPSPMTMYGICENESCDIDQLRYMAAVGVNYTGDVPAGMIKRHIRAQKFFQATVPEQISVPDSYMATIGYARSLGYELDEYDQIEVYEDIFRDPADHSFKLWIPVK